MTIRARALRKHQFVVLTFEYCISPNPFGVLTIPAICSDCVVTTTIISVQTKRSKMYTTSCRNLLLCIIDKTWKSFEITLLMVWFFNCTVNRLQQTLTGQRKQFGKLVKTLAEITIKNANEVQNQHASN